MRQPPAHVVLSACELGMSSVRAGDETIGMVAALLSAGSTTVASVCLVADGGSAEVMVPYHREVAAGSMPAAALASAVSHSPHAGFVCFGSSRSAPDAGKP